MSEEHRLLSWLDSWRLAAAFAVGLAILLGIWSIKLTADTHNLAVRNRDLAAAVAIEQEKRSEAEQASNQNQVNTCFQRNAQSPGLLALLVAIRPTVANDPKGRAAIDDYIELVGENVPSKKVCMHLAKKLGVAVPKGS